MVRGRMAWHGFRLRGSGLYENDPGRNDGKQDDVRYCLLFSQCCNFNQVCGVAEAHDGQSWEPSVIFLGVFATFQLCDFIGLLCFMGFIGLV